MKAITCIYILIDPLSREVRYVGKTHHALKDRLRVHLHDKRKSHKSAWINSLVRRNVMPIIEVIEECDDLTWSQAERFWISYLKFLGFRLTNLANGGQGSGAMSTDTREKISRAHKLRLSDPVNLSRHRESFTKGHRAKVLSQRKRFQDPDHADKMTKLRTEAFSRPEVREKMSLSQKKRFQNPSEIQRNREFCNSPIERRRRSLAAKKRWSDPAFRAMASIRIKESLQKKKEQQTNTTI